MELAPEPDYLLSPEEAALPIEVWADRMLRLNLTWRCGLACSFCHNEGERLPTAGVRGIPLLRAQAVNLGMPADRPEVRREILLDERSTKELLWLTRRLAIDEWQLTGGQPTRNPEFLRVLSLGKLIGVLVKMTSNGEHGGEPIADYKRHGLRIINYSMYGSTADDFLATQAAGFPRRSAERVAAKLREAMTASVEQGLDVKVNLVITGEHDLPRIEHALALDPKIRVRLQAEIHNQRAVLPVIRNYLRSLGGVPVKRVMSVASSNQYIQWRLPEGYQLDVKEFRYNSRLPRMCAGCSIDAAGDCVEGYYGPRVKANLAGGLMVQLCLLRGDLDASVADLQKDDKAHPGVSLLDEVVAQPYGDAMHLIPHDVRTMRAVDGWPVLPIYSRKPGQTAFLTEGGALYQPRGFEGLLAGGRLAGHRRS